MFCGLSLDTRDTNRPYSYDNKIFAYEVFVSIYVREGREFNEIITERKFWYFYGELGCREEGTTVSVFLKSFLHRCEDRSGGDCGSRALDEQRFGSCEKTGPGN